MNTPKAHVKVDYSYDRYGTDFYQRWHTGCFKRLFKDAEEELDYQCSRLHNYGKDGDEFTITLTVTVKKGE